MNRIIFFFLILFLTATACCAENAVPEKETEQPAEALDEQEDKKEETIETPTIIDYKYFPGKRTHHKNQLQRSPKAEHYRTMDKVKYGHSKNKADFKKRINLELELLKEEYEILDYHP